MKKKVVAAVGLIMLAMAFLYIFIPNIITFKSSAAIKVTQKGLHRILLDKQSMAKWWPGSVSNDSFYFNGRSYQIYDNTISLMPINIMENNKAIINSSLLLIKIETDSLKLEWVGNYISSNNPINRLSAYFEAKDINHDMNTILQKIQQTYSLPKNIYNCTIQEEQVVDANLISTSDKCKNYPSNDFIYGLINKLDVYATQQRTKITGYPMLNIEGIDSGNYLVRVALPLEKLLPSNGNIQQKRMLENGKILVTEIKGGYFKTSEAYKQMIIYANDYERNSPAIPFYSLITNRLKETDSTKWITKIYCPVM